MPAAHPRIAHYGRYDKTYLEVVFGDSLEATAKAQAAGYTKIDKNILSTLDYVPVVNHSPELDSFLGGKFIYRWTGKAWGEGDRVLDPKRATSLGHREWSDIALVTDVTGTQRIRTLDDHVRDGVERGVMQVPEGKPQAKVAERRFWHNVGEVMDRYGHPRLMMTLGQYGDIFGRCKAAHLEDHAVAILPRGERPADFETKGRPYVDALWGPAWGPLTTK